MSSKSRLNTSLRIVGALLALATSLLVWSLRTVFSLLALCSGGAVRRTKTPYDRRYSWERGGYTWEGRPDEMK